MLYKDYITWCETNISTCNFIGTSATAIHLSNRYVLYYFIGIQNGNMTIPVWHIKISMSNLWYFTVSLIALSFICSSQHSYIFISYYHTHQCTHINTHIYIYIYIHIHIYIYMISMVCISSAWEKQNVCCWVLNMDKRYYMRTQVVNSPISYVLGTHHHM